MTPMKPAPRRLLILATIVGLLCAGVVAAYHFAVQQLHGALVEALGPRASVGSIDVGWSRIELRDLRIRAEREGRNRWPAEDELRAGRVTVVPDFLAAFSGNWRVGHVHVDKAYVSLHRSRDGKLHVLPALLEKPAGDKPAAGDAAGAAPLVLIDRISLSDAEVDFYDASVRQPAHRMRLADLNAEVKDLKLPALDRAIGLQIEGVFKGPQRDGRLKIDGTLTPATRDADLKADFRGVDLIALQPFLLKMSKGSIRRGTLDLKISAKVQKNQLRAPGKLTLTGLELGDSSLFAGIPQRAVLAAMSDRNGRIEVQFTLAGRLDDPNFSLNENIATRVASALSQSLGVSMGGAVEGVGSVIKGLLGR